MNSKKDALNWCSELRVILHSFIIFIVEVRTFMDGMFNGELRPRW